MAEAKPDLSAREIGRMGGNRTKELHGKEHFREMGRRAASVLKEKYGSEHYTKMAAIRAQNRNSPKPAIDPVDAVEEEESPPGVSASEAGRRGGAMVKERYGSEHFVKAGQLGGAITKQKYGADHYSRIGRMGGMTKARNRSAASETSTDTEQE